MVKTINKNTRIYRLWEMLPGILAWLLILFPIWGAILVPRLVGYFVIAFLVYWFYQSFKSSFFALKGYFLIKKSIATNWFQKLSIYFHPNWINPKKVNHCIIISSY